MLIAGSSRPPVTYKVSVSTSDLGGAGTDANVYLQMHGLLGDGLQHQLLGGATAFDRCVQSLLTLHLQSLPSSAPALSRRLQLHP